jgi:nitrate/TMAO reductase-like tetraheme cytochrome c subunit
MSEPPPEAARRILWTNPLTLIGLLLVPIGVVLLITFWLFHFITPATADTQYVNIIGFLILPGILVTGLILCPLGILFRKWRLKHFKPPREIPVKYAIGFLAVTFFLILPVLGVSGYKGYHYTESTPFCGSCHAVMEPQYARHQQSPHARVTCAGCHVGPGAGPFLESKLAGVRQLFHNTLGNYPRPVPPAISELRPARETCEECHWPEQFFGSQLQTIVHYAHDEQSTRHDYEIRVMVGGKNEELNRAEGIHMHMLDSVEYVATDDVLQEIPWIRYTREDGSKVVYRSDGKPASDPPPPGDTRTLDCIDCHNLSGHAFPSPQRSTDHALAVDLIDDSLPYIKHEAVMVLAASYSSKEEALERIAERIESFYRDRYPDIWKERRDAIDRSVQAIQNVYESTMYPYMKVDWKTYPDNIGHMESPGCFRCHDGLHRDADGQTVTIDCMVCHTFLYRKPGHPNDIVEAPFDHPMKIHNLWEGLGVHNRMLCTDCHDGALLAMGTGLEDTRCGDCHSGGRWLEMKDEVDARFERANVSPPYAQTQAASLPFPTTQP